MCLLLLVCCTVSFDDTCARNHFLVKYILFWIFNAALHYTGHKRQSLAGLHVLKISFSEHAASELLQKHQLHMMTIFTDHMLVILNMQSLSLFWNLCFQLFDQNQLQP